MIFTFLAILFSGIFAGIVTGFFIFSSNGKQKQEIGIYEITNLTLESDTSKALEYLHSHQRWGSPSAYNFDNKTIFLPYCPNRKTVFMVDGIRYEWKAYQGILFAGTRYSLSWEHPAVGFCKITNKVDNNDHIFNHKTYIWGKCNQLCAGIDSSNRYIFEVMSPEDLIIIRQGLHALYTYMKFCEATKPV